MFSASRLVGLLSPSSVWLALHARDLGAARGWVQPEKHLCLFALS